MRQRFSDLGVARSIGILATTIGWLLSGGLAACPAWALPATAIPDDTLSQLIKLTENSKLLAIGEMHGTAEVPQLVAAIARRWSSEPGPDGKARAVLVALEYPQTQAAILAAYVDSDGGEAAKATLLASQFWSRAAQDGRSSRAMFELIDSVRALRHDGRKLQIAAFDMNADQINAKLDRDLAMANNLRAIIGANPTARVLVLAGNYHVRQRDGAGWDPAHRFMFGHLKDLAPFSLKVDAYAGQYWSCRGAEASSCMVSSFARASDEQRPLGLYMDAPSAAIGYNQALMLNYFSASLAANKAR